uniref:BHLH domain-containing protein n=1 Tax=Varanus komodoensis TaxID=61221 RepID=A0A8D2Q7E4_VARKO
MAWEWAGSLAVASAGPGTPDPAASCRERLGPRHACGLLPAPRASLGQGSRRAPCSAAGSQRQSASQREKLRMRRLAQALRTLRRHLPASAAPAGHSLTKIETLRLAVRYIGHLSALLGLGEEMPTPTGLDRAPPRCPLCPPVLGCCPEEPPAWDSPAAAVSEAWLASPQRDSQGTFWDSWAAESSPWNLPPECLPGGHPEELNAAPDALAEMGASQAPPELRCAPLSHSPPWSSPTCRPRLELPLAPYGGRAKTVPAWQGPPYSSEEAAAHKVRAAGPPPHSGLPPRSGSSHQHLCPSVSSLLWVSVHLCWFVQFVFI